MQDQFGNGEIVKKKADGVADTMNKLLQELVLKCAKSEGIRDYFYIGVIEYGAQVGPAFGGTLSGKELIPISEVASSPARIEERKKKVDDGAGGLVEQIVRFPIWFESAANGGTPMCQAMAQAQTILSNWLSQHPNSFPPTVINITDGESTDGDPTAIATGLKNLTSTDGNVLLLNVHLSSQPSAPIVFPDSETGLVDQYAQLLYKISSILPDHLRDAARESGYSVSENTRGFAFNVDLVAFINFLNIGTRPSNLR